MPFVRSSSDIVDRRLRVEVAERIEGNAGRDVDGQAGLGGGDGRRRGAGGETADHARRRIGGHPADDVVVAVADGVERESEPLAVELALRTEGLVELAVMETS